MKKNKNMPKFIITCFFICLSAPFIFAQHIDIDKKALSFLASQEEVNVIFENDSLLMIDNLNEMDFIQKMRNKISGQSIIQEANNWTLAYNENKYKNWPKAFIDQLNEKLEESEHSPKFELDNSKALYTMKVKPTWMYFGYDAGIMDRPAKVTLQVYFYETKSPENIMFSTEISRAMAKYNKQDGDGEGAGPSLNRMRKAYAFAAYKFAKSLETVLN